MLVEILLIRSKTFQLSTWIKQETFSCKHSIRNKTGITFRKMVWYRSAVWHSRLPWKQLLACVKSSSPGSSPWWLAGERQQEPHSWARGTQRPQPPPGLHSATATSWQSKLLLYSLQRGALTTTMTRRWHLFGNTWKIHTGCIKKKLLPPLCYSLQHRRWCRRLVSSRCTYCNDSP